MAWPWACWRSSGRPAREPLPRGLAGNRHLYLFLSLSPRPGTTWHGSLCPSTRPALRGTCFYFFPERKAQRTRAPGPRALPGGASLLRDRLEVFGQRQKRRSRQRERSRDCVCYSLVLWDYFLLWQRMGGASPARRISNAAHESGRPASTYGGVCKP